MLVSYIMTISTLNVLFLIRACGNIGSYLHNARESPWLGLWCSHGKFAVGLWLWRCWRFVFPGPSRIKIDRCWMENLATRTHTQIHLQRMMALSVLGVYTTWTKYVKLHLMLELLPKKVTQSFTAEKQHRGPRWVLVASCLASNCALPRRPSSSGRVENVDCNSKSPPTTPWTSVTSS